MKRPKLKRIKHTSDVHPAPLLPMEWIQSMKRASSIPSKRRYIRRANKEVIKEEVE